MLLFPVKINGDLTSRTGRIFLGVPLRTHFLKSIPGTHVTSTISLNLQISSLPTRPIFMRVPIIAYTD